MVDTRAKRAKRGPRGHLGLAVLVCVIVLLKFFESPDDARDSRDSPVEIEVVELVFGLAKKECYEVLRQVFDSDDDFHFNSERVQSAARDDPACLFLALPLMEHEQILGLFETSNKLEFKVKIVDPIAFALAFSRKGARAVAKYYVDESVLDESCLERAKTKDPKCSVYEYGLLRNVELWRVAHSRIFRFLNAAGETDYTEVISFKESFQYLTSVENDSFLKLAARDDLARAFANSKPLMRQVLSLLSTTDSSYTSLSALPVSPRASSLPPKFRVDAGFCFLPSEMANSRGGGFKRVVLPKQVKGYCLPTFIMAGAQKAGTDELAIWANFNDYNRRYDGGIETHFFDCVARGRGTLRDSCFKGHKTAYHEQGVDVLSKEDALKVEAPNNVVWSSVNKKSPYVDDLWKQYARFGQTTSQRFDSSTTRLAFEKTPSYLDLANPMDVYRVTPSVKLIFLLRDPSARAYSGYWQRCNSADSNNDCSPEKFHNGLRSMEVDATKHDDPYIFRSITMGYYSRQLKPWTLTFPKSQILVLFSEDFRSQPTIVMRALETFVGHTTKQRRRVYNPIKSRKGYWVLGGYSKAFNPSHKRQMNNETLTELRAHYRKYNSELKNTTLKAVTLGGELEEKLKKLPDWVHA